MQTRRVLILFLALFAAGCSRAGDNGAVSTAQLTDQAAGAAFKTPEEAITSYLDGVARNDVRKILQSSAVNETGEKFKFDLYAEGLGVINPTFLSPADYAFYSEINKAQLSSQLLN